MIGYKLFRIRRDNTLGPLFINRSQIIPIGVWLKAELHKRSGFKVRKGWHICPKPFAPHLKMKLKNGEQRVWKKVEMKNYIEEMRPKCQGGLWFLAQRMRVKGNAKNVCAGE